MSAAPRPATPARRPRVAIAIVAGLAVAALAAVALLRGGLLDLPRAPRGLTAEGAGLADLAALRARAASLTPLIDSRSATLAGLDSLRAAVRLAPRDLVIGNAYRMAVFRMKRAALAATDRGSLAATLPPELEGQPIAFLDSLHRDHPGRETTLQLALGWVDELILYGALEIKAPASIQSVTHFSEILAENPTYVPALYGRGLNYLHRPARLVWPEAKKAPRDAASHDLGLCIAIGRKIGGARPALVATLALALGDAYAREGRPERARSWWQIAANSGGDAEVHESVRRRFAWRNEEMLDRLEQELEGRMLDLDHPLSDLSVMWR